jgi:hypothetical protein
MACLLGRAFVEEKESSHCFEWKAKNKSIQSKERVLLIAKLLLKSHKGV